VLQPWVARGHAHRAQYVAADRAQDSAGPRERDARSHARSVVAPSAEEAGAARQALARVNADAQSAPNTWREFKARYGRRLSNGAMNEFGSFDVVMWPIDRSAVDLLM